MLLICLFLQSASSFLSYLVFLPNTPWNECVMLSVPDNGHSWIWCWCLLPLILRLLPLNFQGFLFCFKFLILFFFFCIYSSRWWTYLISSNIPHNEQLCEVSWTDRQWLAQSYPAGFIPKEGLDRLLFFLFSKQIPVSWKEFHFDILIPRSYGLTWYNTD